VSTDLVHPGSMLMLANANGGAVALLFTFSLTLHIVICWFLADALRRIPERYRFQEPRLVWLLLIPIFNLWWNFKVYPAIAESFQVVFYSRGIADVDDCGEGLARAYCWLSLSTLIPCVNFLTVPASLVVAILFLIQTDRLKTRLATMTGV
jgi:hypothetical protein